MIRDVQLFQTVFFDYFLCERFFYLSVARNRFLIYSVGVNVMVSAFTEEIPAVVLKLFDKIAVFHRQSPLLLSIIRI